MCGGAGELQGGRRRGSCSPVEVEDAGLGRRAELVREGFQEVCVRGSRVGGGALSRIDQALEEADCATFEDEGTITPLGSVSRRRGSQTTRGKAL